jgi:hypothetical protein
VAESLEQHIKKLTEESNRGLETAPAPTYGGTSGTSGTSGASGASSHPGRRHWACPEMEAACNG